MARPHSVERSPSFESDHDNKTEVKNRLRRRSITKMTNKCMVPKRLSLKVGRRITVPKPISFERSASFGSDDDNNITVLTKRDQAAEIASHVHVRTCMLLNQLLLPRGSNNDGCIHKLFSDYDDDAFNWTHGYLLLVATNTVYINRTHSIRATATTNEKRQTVYLASLVAGNLTTIPASLRYLILSKLPIHLIHWRVPAGEFHNYTIPMVMIKSGLGTLELMKLFTRNAVPKRVKRRIVPAPNITTESSSTPIDIAHTHVLSEQQVVENAQLF